MRRATGGSITEVVVIISVLVLAVAFLLPLLSARSHRGPAPQMQNSTQVRGIHTGLVLYAQGNNGWYPGLMSDGQTIDPTTGLTVEGRIQKLINENYFIEEYARSPAEKQKGITSYALLQIDTTPDGTRANQSVRHQEWKDTTNSEAVIISDRAIDNGGSFTHIKSVHTPKTKSGVSDWRGSVAWNDNHVTFESTHTLSTKYNDVSHANDHLFINQTGDAHTGSDAFMVYSGTNEL